MQRLLQVFRSIFLLHPRTTWCGKLTVLPSYGCPFYHCQPIHRHNVTHWSELMNASGRAIRTESCHTFHPNHGTPSSWQVWKKIN